MSPSLASRTSFIIPCYRHRRTIGFTLRSILSVGRAEDAEVIVVDSSEESIAEWLRTHFPGVRVIHSQERLYPGAARNHGARQAGRELLAFVDADTVLEAGWLEGMGQALGQDSLMAGGYIGNANPGSLSSRILHWTEFSEFLPGLPGGPREFLSSSNLLIRRADFLDSGGFPEQWPASEDRLFCVLLGKGLVFCNRTGVRHYHRSRWGEALRHLQHLGYWGGRVRTREALPGTRLARFPAAALALGPYRALRVAGRIIRSNPRLGLSIPLLFLPLFWANAVWAAGFRRGLLEGRREMGDRSKKTGDRRPETGG